MKTCDQRCVGRLGQGRLSRSRYCLPFLLLLAACQTTHPYKMELAQDNFISAGKIMRLKAGMTKAQVANVLGTPLLAEHVQADEWEYTYTAHQAGRPDTQAALNLYFQGDTLARFDGQLPPGPAQLVTASLRPARHYRHHKRRITDRHRHKRIGHRRRHRT